MKSLFSILFGLLCLWTFPAFSQSPNQANDAQALALAKQYFQDQEYEKVIDKLEDLGERSVEPQVYQLLFDSYLVLEEYRDAIKLSRDWARRLPGRKANFEVDQLYLHLKQEDQRDAEKLMESILEIIDRSPGQAYAYGKALSDRGYTQRALSVYQHALKENSNMNFDYQMALLFGELGDIPKMHEMYLQMVERTPGYLATVKALLAQSIEAGQRDENLELLKQEIIKRIQSGAPERFNELLIHIYSQEENFRAAFTQLRALDRQGRLEGKEISNLARLAYNAGDFDLAARIYKYELDKGDSYSYYQSSVIAWLDSRKHSLQESESSTLEAWQSLAADYEQYGKGFRGDPFQADLMIPLAEVYAYRLNQADTAEAILTSLFDRSWIGEDDQALAQIAYADLLLFTGRRWDAIIYYRKAEKALDQSVIGQEAKFKRAKAAYYVGDFQWAQGIFSVLKESTSKLIANDAMQYSLLITDNMALDSTTEALEAYARADLFYYREIYDSALAILEVLDIGYADHPIADESLYLRASIKRAQHQDAEAIKLWQRVVDEYSDDILVDDALYEIGKTEEKLNHTDAAMKAYEQLFTEHVDSFFASDARKAYRRLRGDQIN
ncbi:tetratricopeptide repeat protein [Croceimicrobium sp.]|uniref:tetratricopeptide repeat protein n=1 Tax=Croceimicrobium sp. TaxID=2828340 RepID=UPI003BA9C4D0